MEDSIELGTKPIINPKAIDLIYQREAHELRDKVEKLEKKLKSEKKKLRRDLQKLLEENARLSGEVARWRREAQKAYKVLQNVCDIAGNFEHASLHPEPCGDCHHKKVRSSLEGKQ